MPHPDFILAGGDVVAVATELPGDAPGVLNLIPYDQIDRIEMLPCQANQTA